MSDAIFKDFTDLSKKDRNKLVTGGIIPRPIAWITSLNENGSINLAPFSFFNAVSYDVFSVSFTQKKTGNKDSLRNILRTKEAVVHSASIKNLEYVNASEVEYDYGVSELDALNLKVSPSQHIQTPHLQIAELSYETKLIQHIPLLDENGKPKADIVLLQVVGVHIKKDVYDEEKNYIITEKLNPASRLAGKFYGNTQIDTTHQRKD